MCAGSACEKGSTRSGPLIPVTSKAMTVARARATGTKTTSESNGWSRSHATDGGHTSATTIACAWATSNGSTCRTKPMALAQGSADRRHVTAGDGATVGEADGGAMTAVGAGDATATDGAGLIRGEFEQPARVSVKSQCHPVSRAKVTSIQTSSPQVWPSIAGSRYWCPAVLSMIRSSRG
jgi:hypothetical protein